MCTLERHGPNRSYRSRDRCAAHRLGSPWHMMTRTPMDGRRTAIIAISALAVIQPAACAGDATEQTDAAATVAATATTASAPTQPRPDTTVVVPDTTVVVPDTTVVVSDVTAQLQSVVEETVACFGEHPRPRSPRRGAGPSSRRERRRRRRRPGDGDTADTRCRVPHRQQHQDVHRSRDPASRRAGPAGARHPDR